MSKIVKLFEFLREMSKIVKRFEFLRGMSKIVKRFEIAWDEIKVNAESYHLRNADKKKCSKYQEKLQITVNLLSLQSFETRGCKNGFIANYFQL